MQPTTSEPCRCAYLVTVTYQEPSYALHQNRAPRRYHARFKVMAVGEADARRQVLEEFERAQRLSSVGWVRLIDTVEVQRVDS